jgi:nucleoside-diphosphate-sugar epimerase
LKVLVTGGAGFLGRQLVAALQERDNLVRVLDRPSQHTERLARRGAEIYPGDIRSPDSLTAPMRGVDAVFHLAGMTGIWAGMDEYHAVNVTGTENVCRAALTAGIPRLIHISSWIVYGMGIGRPADEDSLLAPLNEPCSVTKTLGDRLVQRMIAQDGLPATIVRPDTIIGAGDHVHIGRTADRLRSGRGIIVGSGQNAMPFVYVSDIVQGLLLALDRPTAVGQVYNIGHDQPLSQEAILRSLAEEVGAQSPGIRVPYRVLYTAAGLAEQRARLLHSARKPILTRLGVAIFGTDNRHAIDKARRELGYSPAVPVREGIRRAAEWYRQEYLNGQVAVSASSR